MLRHYAFADRWFKINVTTDLAGRPAVYGTDGFTFNCDVATPMVRGDTESVFAVDLFLDVLVGISGRDYEVVDREEFVEAHRRGLVSDREADAAEAGLIEVLTLIRAGALIAWLDAACPFGPSGAPAVTPVERAPVTDLVAAHTRPSW